MKSAPAWVSYASGAIALLALLVSFATYTRAGPRVRAKLSPSGSLSTPGDVILELTITNSGLAPVDILAFYCAFPPNFGIGQRGPAFVSSDVYEGEDLPYRIEGGSTKTWTIGMKEMLKNVAAGRRTTYTTYRFHRLSLRGRPHLLFVPGVSVDLGNGISVYAAISLWTWLIFKRL